MHGNEVFFLENVPKRNESTKVKGFQLQHITIKHCSLLPGLVRVNFYDNGFILRERPEDEMEKRGNAIRIHPRTDRTDLTWLDPSGIDFVGEGIKAES